MARGKKYTQEFKDSAIQLALNSKLSSFVKTKSKFLFIPPSMLLQVRLF